MMRSEAKKTCPSINPTMQNLFYDYQLFVAGGFADDRRLFVNLYNIALELEREQPITEAGQRAISKESNEYRGRLLALWRSLKERDMLTK